MLLDVKRTFDELVSGLASTPEQARRVLDNRLYQNLSGTLAGSAEYMAVESVLRLAETGDYDLLVVDTPPARHAVDFLDAPSPPSGAPRLARLLHPEGPDQHPAGRRIAHRALRPQRSAPRPRALHRHRTGRRDRRVRARHRGPHRRAPRARRAGERAARERRDRTRPGHGAGASPHRGDRGRWRARSPPSASARTASS